MKNSKKGHIYLILLIISCLLNVLLNTGIHFWIFLFVPIIFLILEINYYWKDIKEIKKKGDDKK